MGRALRCSFACIAALWPRSLAYMTVPTLTINDPPQDVLEDHVHCLTTMAADPLCASLAPAFEGQIADWTEVNTLRIQRLIAIAQAVANAFQLDLKLNRVVDDLVNALQKLTKKDKSDPLWTVFLNGQEPAQFKKPILAGQLATMLLWPPALAASTHPELNDIGTALAALLPDAVAAEQAVAAAKQTLVTFDNVGRWRQHVDQSNAVRAAAYGALLEIPHQNPALKLPLDYADLYFLHDTSRRGANKPRSSAEIAAEIKALTVKAEQLQAPLKDALAREQTAAEALARREQAAKELAAVNQQGKEMQAKKKELEKELGKKKK